MAEENDWIDIDYPHGAPPPKGAVKELLIKNNKVFWMDAYPCDSCGKIGIDHHEKIIYKDGTEKRTCLCKECHQKQEVKK